MNEYHLQHELAFYRNAFKNNTKRRENKYGWEFKPSKTVLQIVKKNKLTKDAHVKRVLDVGCGDGRHIEYFRKLGFEVWGVDFSKEAIALCKKRFAGDIRVHLEIIDLTEIDCLSRFGCFDIVIDWSVLDHIRKQYQENYVQNIVNAIAIGGYGIFTEFNKKLPGLFVRKNYKIVSGHYSRAFTISQLKQVLKPLKSIDQILDIEEGDVNKYRFNTVLMQKI